jgi:hypothetical protein
MHVARVRYRGENINSHIILSIKQTWKTNNSCHLSIKNWNGSRHLLF